MSSTFRRLLSLLVYALISGAITGCTLDKLTIDRLNIDPRGSSSHDQTTLPEPSPKAE